MISIRPFYEGDNEKLLEIERLCPQGNDSCAMGIKKTDIIARYRMYENWKVQVAEDDGKIAGWIGWTVKCTPTQKEQHVYLVEVMVHPKFRRRGVATKLVAEAERDAIETDSDHIYCCIYEPNDASKTLFKDLGYSNVANIKREEDICRLASLKSRLSRGLKAVAVEYAPWASLDSVWKTDIQEVPTATG